MDGPGPDAPTDPTAPRARAVVSLSGPVLRYAEIIWSSDGAPRIRRLGAVDFEFDAEQTVFGDGELDGFESVSLALREAFDGAPVATLVVAAHPAATTSFFTPLPAGMTEVARAVQLHEEAALLADLAAAQAVRIHAAPVRTERTGGREWYHVVHVSDAVHVRLSRLADALEAAAYDIVDTSRAAAQAARADADDVVVTVGAYDSHTEVGVSRGGAFLYGHLGLGTTPADTVYFALDALRQVGLDAIEVDRLVAYGDAAGEERLSLMTEFLGREVRPLDPFGAYSRRPGGDPAEVASFAPVLGAVLG